MEAFREPFIKRASKRWLDSCVVITRSFSVVALGKEAIVSKCLDLLFLFDR